MKARGEKCSITDEAIVVIKSEPMKASNREEGKTQMTHHIVDVTTAV